MAISEAMNGKLNEQITNEFNAEHTYLSMACMYDGLGLAQLAAYFRKQSDEERGHALKIMDYLLEAEGTVKLQAVPQPPHNWDSVLAAIEAALEHERRVTGQIHALVELAEREKDFATHAFLDWFVNEQVEEVASMVKLRDVAKLAGNALLMIDMYVGHAIKRD
jgi:ferritin